MKNDTINRQDAIDAIFKTCRRTCSLSHALKKRFEQLPAAQSESKTGKWIEAYDPFNRISGRCSACGWEAHLYEDDVVGMNFCPNCGLRMEGEIK